MNISHSTKIMICLLLVTLVFIKQYDTSADGGKEINPKPPINTPTPVIIVPKLEDNFVYDNLDRAIQLGKIHKRNVIVVFGAEWCPYCRVLKKDSKSIKQLDKYIVCFLDTDNKKSNQKNINKYKPKNLPTSVLIDVEYQEISRKVGYRKKDYILWINSLP